MTLHDMPALNACLNAASALLLAAGFRFIRRGRRTAHRACMLAAVTTSTLFLISYVTYHAQIGSVPFHGTGWIRPIYFAILITHTILAMAILPLVAITLTRALRERFTQHARIARYTLPIWFYVSVTGVVVYWMLYHLG
jgi:putative membrane protein